MTGSGLSLPCPVYKYRGMEATKICGICSGMTGFSVSRHVHITFASRKVQCLAWTMKLLLYIGYGYYVGLLHKEYLDYGHLDGVSRLQLQHPVNHCNPLKNEGCPTNFENITDLPYCSQNENHINITGKGEDAKYLVQPCKYYDAFDMGVQGEIPRKTLFIPTRITKYEQDVNCPPDGLTPCPKVTKLTEKETFFTADVENFTVLIDHSFVSDELNVEMCSWSMLGFINPCGTGSRLDERFFAGARDSLKEHFTSMRVARAKSCEHKMNGLVPIIPSEKLLEELDSKDTIERREKGTAMWLAEAWQTLGGMLTTPSYETVIEEAKEDHRISKFTKLPNGDFIKISDLLHLAGASLDYPEEKNNRYEGLVLILNVEYTNVKENSWPNAVPPAYFYSAWVAPASEYKAMQEMIGLRRFEKTTTSKREIMDYHGIFIVVKQGGHIGAFSFGKLAVLVFIFMAIDSLYRSLFLCCIFNTYQDTGRRMKNGKEEEDKLELDDKVTFDFHLYGKTEDEDRSSDSETDDLIDGRS